MMQQHDLSAIFPAMSGEEFDNLVADVEVHGLHQPVYTFEGKILDGWHRYLACEKLQINCRFTAYEGGKPVEFVKSHNWHRRHMSASQRAQCIVALYEWLPNGLNSAYAPGAQPESLNSGYAPGAQPKSTADMAKEAGTSIRTIIDAKTVQNKGSDEVKDLVRKGNVSVKKAAAQASGKIPKPETPLEETAPSIVEELERADKEILALQTLVESLKKDDSAKEIASWHLKFDQLEGRLQQCMTTQKVAEGQAKYSTILLEKIRKTLAVEKNNEILPAIAALKK